MTHEITPEQQLLALVASRATEIAQLKAQLVQHQQSYRCFHCGEVFTTPGGAADHFGATPNAVAGCLIDRVALEEGGKPERGRGLLMALRKVEARAEAAEAALRNAQELERQLWWPKQLLERAESAERDKAHLQEELTTERLRLAAVTSAALGNTRANQAARLTWEHPYWSASYGDVCDAVDREIEHREALEKLQHENERLRGECAQNQQLLLHVEGALSTVTTDANVNIALAIDEREKREAAERALCEIQKREFFAGWNAAICHRNAADDEDVADAPDVAFSDYSREADLSPVTLGEKEQQSDKISGLAETDQSPLDRTRGTLSE
jgi:hypothetical protein